MSLPEWVRTFRESKTEIKLVKGGYYKYAVEYRYNSEKKRTDKITGVLLGKITQQDGFIASDKNQIRTKLDTNRVDIKNYGLYQMFSTLVEEELAALKKVFPQDVCELLFSFAMFRWAYNAPIKRAPYYYDHDFSSQVFGVKSVDDKVFSNVLKTVGEQRTKVVEWMKSLLGNDPVSDAEFVMMDSTHVHSKSDLLTVNAKGYNPDFDYERQVRLMYLFSAQMQKPVYYRLINGNITDVKSMSLCMEEMKVENVIYIADKGFYSKENIAMMKLEGLQYIVPLQRKNSLIDYKPLRGADFKLKLSYFIYQRRIIWYYRYEAEGENFITFLDESLRAHEESDYAARIVTLPDSYTKDKFIDKLNGFGTLTFTCNIKSEKTCEEIYQAYKQRNEIETIFDAYKNFLLADVMYMQNRYVLEGWLTANFIAMIAYHKLYLRLREAKKLNNYSPKDIIELSKSIYRLKINNEWKISEITKKTRDLFKLLKIDYLT
ncbi:MAG: hypothetical protein EAY75_10150 [Bacteroidetes bacterium]|nr:MAG: hypothetical protein EAY75_10150 [Bacteroidota bacterium]